MKCRATNPIIHGYPAYVVVNGVRKDIRTGFRYWMQAALCIEDGTVSDTETLYTLYALADLEPTDAQADMEALLGFLAGGEPTKGRADKVMDFGQDAGLLVASFQMQYGMDLSDPKVNLHWWHFLDLLAGLSDDTPIMRVIQVRTADLPSGKDEATRKRRAALKKAKRDYRLIPRNPEQMMKREAEVWNDG